RGNKRMLAMFRWIALISAMAFVIAMAGVLLSSQPAIEPAPQQTAEKNQTEQQKQKGDIALWDRWFPDAISVYTLFLVLFTAVLALVAAFQWKSLIRAELIAAQSANAAKESADVAKQALVNAQRAFVFMTEIPARRVVDQQTDETLAWLF